MNSEKHVGKKVRNTAAALLCLAFAGAAAGCESLIKTDNEADMSRVIAEVNITKENDFAEGGKYAAYKGVVESSNGKIYKRDLVSAFLSSGYSSVQSGSTYKDTFNKLVETLVARKITVQYSMAYFLDEDGYSAEAYNAYLAAQKEKGELKDVEEEKRAQILTLKYFLTDGGTAAAGAENNDYDRAVYSLKKAVNSSLDSSETSFMRETNDTSSGEIDGAETARTLPTDINTEKSDYYTTDYEIYTGYNTPDSCGEYEKQKNSTRYSRRAAYNQFVTNLVSNGLIPETVEETTEFMQLDYFYVELLSQLEQSMISKFAEAIDEKADAALTAEKVKQLYNDELAAQRKKYDASLKDFETDIGSLSKTKFVLYAPARAAKKDGKYQYGYVYNILIPFSATDTQRISSYKNDAEKATTDAEKAARMEKYYAARANAANNIVAKDQRTGWFSNEKASNYAEKREDGKWYFFDKFTGNTKRYESAAHYSSAIAFDGDVDVAADGKIKSVTPSENKKIVDFVELMEEKLGEYGTITRGTTDYKSNPAAENNEFKWQDFMLLRGKLDVGSEKVAAGTYFADKTSAQYKAVTAVNELVFAYGTDPGMLNSYIGYTVTPTCDETFVKEFAYAAKEAVAGGVGSYTVCLTDYGWHIMYCNYVYDNNENGAVYGSADEIFAEANMENGEYKEDTFARYFYESVKSKLEGSSSIVQEKMLAAYNTENAVTKYTARYQDLLDMDKK